MDLSVAFQILVSSSVVSIVALLIKAFIDRRKVHVDTDSVLVNTSLAQVNSAVAQMVQATADVTAMKEEMRKVRATIRAHETWDRMVLRELERNQINVDPPPELFFV